MSAFPSTLAPQGAKREQVPGPNKGGICKGSLPGAVALREGQPAQEDSTGRKPGDKSLL